MERSIRSRAVALIALPIFVLATAASVRAATITVDTTASGEVAGACTLDDAILSANNHATPVGSTCAAGTGDDRINFSVTGTIFAIGELITDPSLVIEGPLTGGIVLDAATVTSIMEVEGVDKLRLANLTFANGDRGRPNAGALTVENSDVLIVDNCTFTNNRQLGNGGAVLLRNTLLALITNSTFANNDASDGAAIYAGDADVGLVNDTFSGNTSSGGAVSGAGVVAEGTIFKSGASGSNCAAALSVDEGYNISNDNSCGLGGLSLSTTDAMLDPAGLQNNGGPTQTIALQAGSPAIDFIPIAACTDLMGNPLTTDQRLFGRPDAGNPGACDSGAYEVGAKAPIVVSHTKLQFRPVHHPIPPNLRDFNLAITYGENAVGTCQRSQDALNAGIVLDLFPGTCAAHPSTRLELSLNPFVVRTAGRVSFGTFSEALPSGGTVSARMMTRPVPMPADSCGEWALDLEANGIDVSSLNLGGAGPFALELTTTDGAFAGCVDIADAIGRD